MKIVSAACKVNVCKIIMDIVLVGCRRQQGTRDVVRLLLTRCAVGVRLEYN